MIGTTIEQTTIEQLLAAEQDEQATWTTEIPSWHPRNEGDDGTVGDDGGGIMVDQGGEPDDDSEDTGLPAAQGEPDGEPESAPVAQQPAEDRVIAALEQFGSKITGQLQEIAPPAAPAQETPAAQESFERQLDRLIDSLPEEDDDRNFDEEGNLTAEGQLALMAQVARDAAQAAAQEAVAPITQRDIETRRAAEADALEEKYPRLQDAAFQDQMVDRTIALARKLGHPELAAEPAFFESTYLAYEAEQRVAAETPAAQTPTAHVERTTAAAPARPSKPKDDGDRIVGLAKKSRFRLGE